MLSRQSNYSFGTKIYIVLYAPYVSMLYICMYYIEIEGEDIQLCDCGNMLANRFEKPPSFVLIRIYVHKWNVTYL